MTIATYAVSGMTCAHCVQAVSEEVGKLEGVVAVDVELSTGKVIVTSAEPVPGAALAAALDEAGYELVA